MLTLDNLENFDDLRADSAVPDVGADLMAAEAAGYFEGMPADRLMAALELLRHREITLAQAAVFVGFTKDQLLRIAHRLAIPVEL